MWSIVMEPGKKYSTIVENTFHLSMATLDLKTVAKGNDDIHTVYVQTDDNARVILCHLSKASKLYQCKLDHVFQRGTDLKFVTSATANIHMTGYLDPDEDNELYSDLESVEEEETPISKNQKPLKGNKRKIEEDSSKKNKSLKLTESDDNDDDDDDDSDDEIMDYEDDDSEEEGEGLSISDLLDDEAESSDDNVDNEDDDDEEDDEEEDDDSEEEPTLTKKVKEQQKTTPKKQFNGNEQKIPKKEQKTPKNEQKTPKNEQKTPKNEQKTPKGQKTPMPNTPNANKSLINGSISESGKKKKTKPDTPLPKEKQNQHQKLNGGVVIQDLKIGEGSIAKPGQIVKVYYTGRLKSTGKVFDSILKGPGFTFGLQRGEVIKGWDIGISGMKVGGKRKIICPPNMAYGGKGSPPEIPPNSTLIFDVELKHVN